MFTDLEMNRFRTGLEKGSLSKYVLNVWDAIECDTEILERSLKGLGTGMNTMTCAGSIIKEVNLVP